MVRPTVLVPDAVLGRRYHIVLGDVAWVLVHLRISHQEGLDANSSTALAVAVGELPHGTRLHFRATSWNALPDGLPVIGVPELAHLLLPGGVMDASNVLSLLVAEIEPGAVVEFRAAGAATVVLDRIEAAISAINARTSP